MCVDGREEWKDGLHSLQTWFNVTDFLVSLFASQCLTFRIWIVLVLVVLISGRNYMSIFKQHAVLVLTPPALAKDVKYTLEVNGRLF